SATWWRVTRSKRTASECTTTGRIVQPVTHFSWAAAALPRRKRLSSPGGQLHDEVVAPGGFRLKMLCRRVTIAAAPPDALRASHAACPTLFPVAFNRGERV